MQVIQFSEATAQQKQTNRFEQLSEKDQWMVFGCACAKLPRDQFDKIYQLLGPDGKAFVDKQVDNILTPHKSGLSYDDRFSRYMTERMFLEKRLADRPASEIAARFDALAKKWSV